MRKNLIVTLSILLLVLVASPVTADPGPEDVWCFWSWFTAAQPSGFEMAWDVACASDDCQISLNVAPSGEGCMAGLQPWRTLQGVGARRFAWPLGLAPRPGDVACLRLECAVEGWTGYASDQQVVAPDDTWEDYCTPTKLEVTGVGMEGSDIAMAALADHLQVDWLIVQVTGRMPLPDRVILEGDQQTAVLTDPKSAGPVGWAYEASMWPSAQITATVEGPAEGARGLVLYARRRAPVSYTSVGRTANVFLHRSSHMAMVTIPPLEHPSTLHVHGVIIDNNDDTREVVFSAEAGGVAASASAAGPNRGPGLSIVSVTLTEVPTDTSQVRVTFESPPDTGDSCVAMGYNVSYPCVEPGPDVYRIYFPIVMNGGK